MKMDDKIEDSAPKIFYDMPEIDDEEYSDSSDQGDDEYKPEYSSAEEEDFKEYIKKL